MIEEIQMSGVHTTRDVIITWFPIRERLRGNEFLANPVCQEVLPRRRTWTTVRDLIEASNDQEIWRQPTSQEWTEWALDEPKTDQLDTDVAWMVATTGEPGLGIPTRMAVRLQEKVVR